MTTFEQFLILEKNFKHHALLVCSTYFRYRTFQNNELQKILWNFCHIKFEIDDKLPIDILAKQHPDIFIADRERNILRLEDLSFLKELSQYPPAIGKRRFFLIENCERMNTNAANALLKILEEPACQKSLFLLTSAKIQQVLPTIASRCQKIVLTFPEGHLHPKTSHLSEHEYAWIKEQLTNIKNSIPFVQQSLSSVCSGRGNIEMLQNVIQTTEKLAKEYEADILQDAIIQIAAEIVKKEKETLPAIKFLLANIMQWKKYEAFHPSTQLWLIRIFTGFQMN